MNTRTNIEINRLLPFFSLSPFTLSQLFQTGKSDILEKLKENNFTKNMIKHVNGFSKNNFTCNYFEEESIHKLATKHKPDCLKVFHVNIESFASKGKELSSYLKCIILSLMSSVLQRRELQVQLLSQMNFPIFMFL